MFVILFHEHLGMHVTASCMFVMLSNPYSYLSISFLALDLSSMCGL